MWTEFLTHACENITFPQLLLRTVKTNIYLSSVFCYSNTGLKHKRQEYGYNYINSLIDYESINAKMCAVVCANKQIQFPNILYSLDPSN